MRLERLQLEDLQVLGVEEKHVFIVEGIRFARVRESFGRREFGEPFLGPLYVSTPSIARYKSSSLISDIAL